MLGNNGPPGWADPPLPIGPAFSSPRPCLQGYFCPLGSGSATAHPCPRGTFGPRPGATVELDCELCPAGHYCPEGTPSPRPCPEGTLNPREGSPSSRACQPCPAGSYCPGEGNRQPMGPCSAGFYCEGGAASPTPWRHSAFPLSGPCPQGHYCPKGTLYPVPCPTGMTRSSPGGVSEDSCRPCPAGSFCPSLDLSSPPGSCVAGSECPWGPRASGPMAVLCPQGRFCLPGAAWPALCPPGEYQPSLGSDTCLQCPPGFYCPHPGTRVPALCPAHAYCPAGTQAPPPCPPGTFTPQDTGGLREEGDCSICPPGHYCRGGQVWGTCPAGYFCPPGTSEVTAPGPDKSEISCLQGQRCARHCPAGFYCPEGSGGPTLCPPHTVAAAPGAKQQEDCRPCPAGHWCEAGAPAMHPCPAGHYCPGGNESHPGIPQPCPEHTFLAAEGGQSLAACLPCPAGYQCPSPGLSSFEDHPCPPGHWCPGGQGAFLCPPGTFRTEPGASSREDCEHCPPGYYCPGAEQSGRPSVLAVPCGAGSECPAGAVAEATCRAGSYCGPQTGVPPLCPGGYACPAGSSTYTGPGQLCVFPYYCPPGSPHPHACPGGTEALNGSGLRVSEETCCGLCEAGTYRPWALAALPCQPCPPGFSCQQGTESYHSQPCPVGHYCPAGTRSPRPCPSGTFRSLSGAGAAGDCVHCPADTFSAQPGQAGCLPCGSSSFSPPGAPHCTCRGLNRVFQESDGSCICQTGHESLDESSGEMDCQPQVAERCSPGDVRLAATRTCVSPQQYDCSSFCHPVGGELSAGLGICQCREYISAEELCDAQCLATAPQLSLAWGPRRKLILGMKSEAGDSVQRELASTLGPDRFSQGSARVHLVQCGPHGLLGVIISSADMLGSLLLDRPGASSFPAQMLPGPPASRPWQQRCPWTTGPEHPAPQEPSIHPHIPNPMVCLEEGDVILFQLHILRHNRSASHYPVYQKQHLFNSNPRWDFGAFRRLGHLVRETGLTFSRFAHQFLDPGTYVFRDNGQPESMAVVLVKARGAACEPGQAPVQPSSPDQLARHGVLRHRLPNLGPDWAAISGVLLAVGMTTVLLTGLGLLLRPSSQAQARPARAWRPQWRGLGEPHMPTGDVALGDSSLLSENPGPWGSEEGASCTGKAAALGTGKALLAKTLEDFSVRTLYDKLEDQSLHMAAQLSKHRSDALAFYRSASQQLQGLQDLLQGLSTTKQPGLGRVGDPETGARATARTHAGQSEASQGSLTAASPREPWQQPPGGTFRAPAPGRQPELEQALAGLAAALSQTQEPPTGASRQASGQPAEPPLSACHQDPQLASDAPPQPRPPPSQGKHHSTSPLQHPGPGQQSRGDVKGGDPQHPGLAQRHRAFPELQRKTRQVEDSLDALNEEFFQLTAQALALQKEEDKPGQLLPVEDRQDLAEAGESLGPWALRSDQALALEARRACLARRADDLEWELALLLQVAAGRWPSVARR